MRQYIIADDHIGGVAFTAQFLGKLAREKCAQRRHTTLPRRARLILCRINAQNGYSIFDKVFKQVSVVAG